MIIDEIDETTEASRTLTVILKTKSSKLLKLELKQNIQQDYFIKYIK